MRENSIRLSAIWIAHFLLWTFGDMLSLLQKVTEPVGDSLLLFVAVPLGIIQAVMILIPLFLSRKAVRTVSFIVVPVYLFFNVMNYFDVSAGWGYLLTTAYVALNCLTLAVVWRWKAD